MILGTLMVRVRARLHERRGFDLAACDFFRFRISIIYEVFSVFLPSPRFEPSLSPREQLLFYLFIEECVRLHIPPSLPPQRTQVFV